MADPQTLPQLVRQKYPGVYDDLSDADLDAKVRAKFPGVYDDVPKPTSDVKPTATVYPWRKVPGELWQGLKDGAKTGFAAGAGAAGSGAPDPDLSRVDNQLLGVPPELAVAGALPVARAVTAPGLTLASRGLAGLKAAAVQATPAVKYEISKQVLEHIGIPTPLAVVGAMAASGYRGKGAAAAGQTATEAAGETAATASSAVPEASSAVQPAASALPGVPPKILNELAIMARRAGVTLTDEQETAAVTLVQKGATPQQAVGTVKGLRAASSLKSAPAGPSAAKPVETPSGGEPETTLYRAANDDILVNTGSFSTTREGAEAYLDNPGYGGPNLYQTTVRIDPKRALDLTTTAHPVRELAKKLNLSHPGAIGIDEWVPQVADELRAKGIEWVKVPESYPPNTETWIFVGDNDPEMVPASIKDPISRPPVKGGSFRVTSGPQTFKPSQANAAAADTAAPVPPPSSSPGSAPAGPSAPAAQPTGKPTLTAAETAQVLRLRGLGMSDEAVQSHLQAMRQLAQKGASDAQVRKWLEFRLKRENPK